EKVADALNHRHEKTAHQAVGDHHGVDAGLSNRDHCGHAPCNPPNSVGRFEKQKKRPEQNSGSVTVQSELCVCVCGTNGPPANPETKLRARLLVEGRALSMAQFVSRKTPRNTAKLML